MGSSRRPRRVVVVPLPDGRFPMAFIRLDRARRRWPAIGVAPMAAAVVWAALVGIFVVVKPAGSDVTPCMFRNATGVPCPT